MSSRLVFVLSVAALAGCSAARGQTGGPPPRTPQKAVDVSTLDRPPRGLEYYYLVLLHRGPTWTAERTEESRRLGEGHMSNMKRLADEGRLVLAGPFLDSEGPGDLAGLFVFHARTVEEVKALLETDPAVKGGRFRPEIRAWMAGADIRTGWEEPPTAENKARLRCLGSERHTEFDFWIGRWEVKNAKGDLVGRNSIERGQQGCVLKEHWAGAKGITGQSVNYVDPSSGKWTQLWTDATGGVIRLAGGIEGGSMKLAGEHVKSDGATARMRATWTPLPDGRVRQFIEESANGQQWTPWFEGFYSRID